MLSEICANTNRAQEQVVFHLQELYEDLLRSLAHERSLLYRMGKRLLGARGEPVRGLYIWGSVGRGKTFLVDAFHDCLPFEDKLRIHFHRFMRQVHLELKALPRQRDPLQTVARRFAARARVICFDELYVTDITDAMLLGRLLAALFEQGVSLVATSNVAPDNLYHDGLQRERFLPAIRLIQRHQKVVHLAGATDFRLRELERAEIHRFPLGEDSDPWLAQRFSDLTAGAEHSTGMLRIEERALRAVRYAQGAVWFSFEELCAGPRSVADYIEIARCFHTVLVSRIPRMDDAQNDWAMRFIRLIDELYERNVNLICSAEAAPEHLYTGMRLAEPFRRTTSRLVEMRSHDYLRRPHLT
jgi:cell division protein ZapE